MGKVIAKVRHRVFETQCVLCNTSVAARACPIYGRRRAEGRLRLFQASTAWPLCHCDIAQAPLNEHRRPLEKLIVSRGPSGKVF